MRFSALLKRIGMRPFGCHAAIRTSGAARYLFYSRHFSILAQQILTWYGSLIFRAGLPRKMKMQCQLLKAISICPMHFSASKTHG